MKKSVSRLVAVLCILTLIISSASGCINDTENTDTVNIPEPPEVSVQNVTSKPDNSWADEISTKSKDPTEAETDYDGGDTITVGISDTALQNPFFITDGADTTVTDLMMVTLLQTERGGYVVQSGAKGETVTYNDIAYTYNGIASVEIDGNTLHFTLDEDVYFSDGVNLTADDVIFTMYVLADPIYDGENSFASLPIVGLDEYHGTVQQKWKLILHDIASDTKTDGYTNEEYRAFEAAFKEAGLIFTEEIVRGCVENFADDYADEVMGVTMEELMANEGLQIAFSQYFWDYSTGYGDDGLWYDISGEAYDLSETYPTIEEYWQLILLTHGYDIGDNGINYEKIGDRNFSEILTSVIVGKYPYLMEATENAVSAENISGIVKTGMYSFSVTMTELAPEHLSAFCFYVAPLHHYGSRENYKYTENKFGFEKSNLSEIKAKTETPLGAGAYKFEGIDENGNVLLKRNTLYYKGCPNITNLVVSESTENADLYYKAYAGEASYGENHIEAETNAYVIIGINAEQVSVGGDARSDESVSLRNAFVTVFKVFREVAVNQWRNYGVQSLTDETVLSENFSAVTKNAKMEAVRLLKAAGYVWDDELEKFTEAPEGASMSYEVKVFEKDAAYIVLKFAKEFFDDLGITLDITVQSTKRSLENIIHVGEAQMWVMQIRDFSTQSVFDYFHSEGKNEIFSVSSKKLDARIEAAESVFLSDISAEAYEEILEDVLEMGIIVPVYRQVDAVFYSENIVPDSIANDMTSYWTWVREVHLLEAK